MAEKKKRSAITKKTKDPNRIRRATNAYMFWLKETREQFMLPEDAPKKRSAADVAKLAGAAWRELGDKSKWERMAAEDKERYHRETEAQVQGGQEDQSSPVEE